MAFTLDEIVPWGRSYEEYVRMFSLSAADHQRSILGCGDGPASFHATFYRMGGRIVSADPLYHFSAEQIRSRVRDVYGTMMEQLLAHQTNYVWTTIATPAECGRVRLAAMEAFLADFEQGKQEGRYIAAELPALPLADGQFDLALCSHLLFTYSEQLSADFHEQAALELCRVAREVRVFPLLTLGGPPSPYLDRVCERLEQTGYRYGIEPVAFEFQRGANRMLRVWK